MQRSLSAPNVSILGNTLMRSHANNTVRFAARVTNQTFGGATDLLELTLSDGRTLRARIPSQGTIEGPTQFEFSPQTPRK